MRKGIFVVLAIAVFIGRIFITPRLSVPTMEGSYEAAAHLLCGFLILLRVHELDVEPGRTWANWKAMHGAVRLYWRIGWAIAWWELGWIMVQKAGLHR
jgi:hypothetical protein